MNASTFCPIATSKIDETIARLTAAQTVILLVTYFLSANIIPLALLFIDFLIRVSKKPKYSLLVILSKQVQKNFSLPQKPVNAGPKLFATRIGLVFSITTIIFHLFEISSVAYSVAGIFAFCAFLEAAFAYCVACKIYPFVYKFSLKLSGE